MEILAQSCLSESVGPKTSCLKLKFGSKVKWIPYVPKTIEEVFNFIEKSVPPYNNGEQFQLLYFDDEKDCISVQDQLDYESFLSFSLDSGFSPKLFIVDADDETFTYEWANSDLNRTMVMSYIGDSEMKEINEGKIKEIPNIEEMIMLKKTIQEMQERIKEMNEKQIEVKKFDSKVDKEL